MTDIPAQLLAAYAEEYRDHLAALRQVPGQPQDEAAAEEAIRRAHSLKGAARAVDLPVVEEAAHRLESLLLAVGEGHTPLDASAGRLMARVLDAIEDASAAALAGRVGPDALAVLADFDALLTARGLAPPAAPLVVPPHGPQGMPVEAGPPALILRVDADVADRLVLTASRLVGELARTRQVAPLVQEVSNILAGLRRRLSQGRGRSDAAGLAEARAEAERAGRLAVKAMEVLDDSGWTLDALVGRLAADVEHLRLVPADSRLGGYGPMVREIAAAQSKQVIFHASGLEARADRGALAALYDAVLHLLRNAVTHGIESPDERRAAGKDPVGRIALDARVGGGKLAVTVADDGRGIDGAALARAAAARGLAIPADGDAALLRLLVFEPGLSTADTVTPFAGRGLGLTIARAAVARLQGGVDLESEPGRGTRITLSIPAAVVARRLVLLDLRGQVFALPIAAVLRLEMVPRAAVLADGGRTWLSLEGELMPAVDLAVLLGLGGDGPGADRLAVVLMRVGRSRLGLVVDGFQEVRELPVMALDRPLSSDPRLSGVVVLDDGRAALVLSASALVAEAAVSTAPLAAVPAARPVRHVLVVDDSLTTRTLEKSILDSHGYHVVTAFHGRQALECLEAQRFDIVVSDIEMPEMDGFVLLAALRGDPRWRRLPVVLVSSRASEDDRRLARDLGADAYIVKGRFDQDELLGVLERLV